MYLNELEQPELLPIGTRVVKRSGRPFKSTFWINTIKGYTNNPQTGDQLIHLKKTTLM